MIDPSPFDAQPTIKCVYCGVVFPAMDGNALLQYFPRDAAEQKAADL
jgi:hypothetical protein